MNVLLRAVLNNNCTNVYVSCLLCPHPGIERWMSVACLPDHLTRRHGMNTMYACPFCWGHVTWSEAAIQNESIRLVLARHRFLCLQRMLVVDCYNDGPPIDATILELSAIANLNNSNATTANEPPLIPLSSLTCDEWKVFQVRHRQMRARLDLVSQREAYVRRIILAKNRDVANAERNWQVLTRDLERLNQELNFQSQYTIAIRQQGENILKLWELNKIKYPMFNNLTSCSSLENGGTNSRK